MLNETIAKFSREMLDQNHSQLQLHYLNNGFAGLAFIPEYPNDHRNFVWGIHLYRPGVDRFLAEIACLWVNRIGIIEEIQAEHFGENFGKHMQESGQPTLRHCMADISYDKLFDYNALGNEAILTPYANNALQELQSTFQNARYPYILFRS